MKNLIKNIIKGLIFIVWLYLTIDWFGSFSNFFFWGIIPFIIIVLVFIYLMNFMINKKKSLPHPFDLQTTEGWRPTSYNYKKNKEHGRWVWVDDNNTIRKKVRYKYGKRVGKCFYYDENGSILKKETYKDGELIETKEY